MFVLSRIERVIHYGFKNFRSTANCLSSTDCVSVKQRRWPEDIAWHPHGNSLFSVFSADGEDSQVAVLDLNSRKEVNSAVDCLPLIYMLVTSSYIILVYEYKYKH